MLNKYFENATEISPDAVVCIICIILVMSFGAFIYIVYKQIMSTETIIFKDEKDASTDNHKGN